MALELIVRCAAIIFIPFAPIEGRQSLADSSLAGAVLHLGLPNLRTINLAVRRQLGIDLSRSWALAFIQRAALPVLVGVGLFAWAVTGVTTLSLEPARDLRTTGTPVAVFGPGLHFHLPWPLGKIRPVELGVAHLLPIEFILPGGTNPDKSSSVGAEENEQAGWARRIPHRRTRIGSGPTIIPLRATTSSRSEEHGRQSFQLVDIDMAVIYRVGLADAAARNAAYQVTDIDELIQALSGQILVRYFSQQHPAGSARQEPRDVHAPVPDGVAGATGSLCHGRRSDWRIGRGDSSATGRRQRLPRRAGCRDPCQRRTYPYNVARHHVRWASAARVSGEERDKATAAAAELAGSGAKREHRVRRGSAGLRRKPAIHSCWSAGSTI